MSTFPHLTPREVSILRSYPRHGTYQGISDELGLSVQTIKNNVTNILAALNCASIGQAAVLFDRHLRGWADEAGAGL